MMDLALAHSLLPGAQLVGDPSVTVQRVHSDSRSLRAGDLFVALRGERFDAHDYLAQAASAGASAALAERGIAEAGFSGLQVDDSRKALGQLAAAWRRRFQLPLIAVTGSNGKTTVTQMVASMLQAWLGDAALATAGNFNNDIGVPLTLLRLREQHRAAVIELGMNHPGEIAQLAAFAAPGIVLVNNAQREHQEFMASVEAVARENGSAISALDADGIAVFPVDDAYAALWRGLAGQRRCIRFGLDAAADVSAGASWHGDHWRLALSTPQGRVEARLALAGHHNVHNALAATACAVAAGCPLDAVGRGIDGFVAVKGRSALLQLSLGGRPVSLIDDSYNANPDSVRAAIDVLASLPAPRWLLLGDMGEVGEHGPAFHAEVGAYAKQRGIDVLWAAGEACRASADAFDGARHFDGVDQLVAALGAAPPAASILVKGSRFMQMERAVAALVERSNQPAGDVPPTGDRHAA
ncbi:UDP-N-acetylmuramoyl-tripeptide--D-alanyl-D-alanine ligase [Piscinibacter sakaiensis]|uniref:UDP-N-acetylmuramoyl-tripeptide--D-alanyl-D- alanine ligase n=1 Tax=Piscinibacter sakaiensis TaxID=1547922 RepID=UPI003AABA6F9